MKLIFVSYGSLPMPPVKGGAVENLTQMLIDENEVEEKHQMFCIGCYDKQAVLASRKFKNTKYSFIKTLYGTNCILSFTSKVIRRFFCKDPGLSKRYYAYKVSRILKNKYKDADYIIIENGLYFGDYTKHTGIPVIYHAHNDWVGYGVFTEKNAAKISAYITVSNYISNSLLKLNGVKKEKVYRLLNCVDETVFVKNEVFRNNYRKKHGIRDTDILCVFAGRIDPTKGVFELLTAFEKLERKDIYLLLLGGINYSNNGSNEYSRKCDSLINRLGNKVICTGYVPYEKMPDYYSAADIGIMPSICVEAGARVLVEMQIMSLPLLCTSTGGTRDYVDENNVLFLSTENLVNEIYMGLIKLADNKQLRDKFSAKSYENAKRLKKERYYEEFCRIIDAISNG